MSVRPPLLDEVARRGHAVFERGLYNLNIIGIRSPDRTSNKFNDRICVVYRDSDGWVSRTFAATTDPGVYWREHPMNVRGTAIMCPGQYRGAYEIGTHRGKPALVQSGPVSVWRDFNRDSAIDRQGKPDTGLFACNLHRAGASSKFVNRWSAGCQVWAKEQDFEEFMDICHKQVKLTGFKTFTYTLLDQWW